MEHWREMDYVSIQQAFWFNHTTAHTDRIMVVFIICNVLFLLNIRVTMGDVRRETEK